MKNGLRNADKISTSNFEAAGLGLGMIKNQDNLGAVGCNTFGILVAATSATAVSEIDLGETIPEGAVVTGHKITQRGTQTLATATTVSLGYAADPDYLGEHAGAALATAGLSVTSAYATPLVATADRALQIASTNGSGADAGTLIGDYLIHIWGYIPATVDLS